MAGKLHTDEITANGAAQVTVSSPLITNSTNDITAGGDLIAGATVQSTTSMTSGTGLTITNGIIDQNGSGTNDLAGNLTVNGATVCNSTLAVDGNLSVTTALASIQAPNSSDTALTVSQGKTSLSHALTVASGGATVSAGGLTVTAGGATVTAGGLTVTADGANITGGLTVDGQAVTGGVSSTLIKGAFEGTAGVSYTNNDSGSKTESFTAVTSTRSENVNIALSGDNLAVTGLTGVTGTNYIIQVSGPKCTISSKTATGFTLTLAGNNHISQPSSGTTTINHTFHLGIMILNI
mgnify:CR=1 FL=1